MLLDFKYFIFYDTQTTIMVLLGASGVAAGVRYPVASPYKYMVGRTLRGDERTRTISGGNVSAVCSGAQEAGQASPKLGRPCHAIASPFNGETQG